MTNPTSNFGWQMPTSTDLVTDLPADFEVFGQAVDTSLADLKGGTSGQILAKATNADMDFTWITNDVGDITAVTAGTGISGGGTSGAVTITNSMATEIAAKGDLIVGTGSQTFDNLSVGTNGQLLQADSTTATGLKWATISTTPTFIGVMCERSSGTISMTSGVDSMIPFTTEIADTNGFHDNSTNNTRFTVPTGYGGKYLLTGFGFLDVGSNARFTLRFYKNGSENQQTLLQQNINMASNNCALTGSRVVSLVAGDYIEFALRNDNTASPTVYAAFYMTYLGA